MVVGYQRRTTTGIRRLIKTVRGCTGKTPRNIAAMLAATSASIMVRFFCIFSSTILVLKSLLAQKKTFFLRLVLFLCENLAEYEINLDNNC